MINFLGRRRETRSLRETPWRYGTPPRRIAASSPVSNVGLKRGPRAIQSLNVRDDELHVLEDVLLVCSSLEI